MKSEGWEVVEERNTEANAGEVSEWLKNPKPLAFSETLERFQTPLLFKDNAPPSLPADRNAATSLTKRISPHVNLASAPTKGPNYAIRMTCLRLFTVGSLKPFKGFKLRKN